MNHDSSLIDAAVTLGAADYDTLRRAAHLARQTATRDRPTDDDPELVAADTLGRAAIEDAAEVLDLLAVYRATQAWAREGNATIDLTDTTNGGTA